MSEPAVTTVETAIASSPLQLRSILLLLSNPVCYSATDRGEKKYSRQYHPFNRYYYYRILDRNGEKPLVIRTPRTLRCVFITVRTRTDMNICFRTNSNANSPTVRSNRSHCSLPTTLVPEYRCKNCIVSIRLLGRYTIVLFSFIHLILK
jgi:hypothetical protein